MITMSKIHFRILHFRRLADNFVPSDTQREIQSSHHQLTNVDKILLVKRDINLREVDVRKKSDRSRKKNTSKVYSQF